jgi:1,4-dihydroxy-2-naphthoyl-CoA hydrolase
MDRDLDVDQLVYKHGMPRHLGVEFQRLLPDRVVATMPVDHRHLQPLGVLHGGVSLTLAESVATVGAWLNCPAGKVAFGATINADHLTLKCSGSRLTAAGTPDYIDHEKQTWKIEIRDENGRRVCVSRCTLNVVDLDSAFVENGDRSA